MLLVLMQQTTDDTSVFQYNFTLVLLHTIIYMAACGLIGCKPGMDESRSYKILALLSSLAMTSSWNECGVSRIPGRAAWTNVVGPRILCVSFNRPVRT